LQKKVRRNPMEIATLFMQTQARMPRSPKIARGREKKAKPTSRSPLGPLSNASSTSTSSVKLIVHRE